MGGLLNQLRDIVLNVSSLRKEKWMDHHVLGAPRHTFPISLSYRRLCHLHVGRFNSNDIGLGAVRIDLFLK
jgi:hypothetical protein